MKNLIIGLGNPGSEYINTRHNVGFIAIDALAYSFGSDIKFNKKFNSDIAEANFNNIKLLLVKPLTYMNLSGSSVSMIKNYYKIDINNIFVIHDDIDLELGRIKIKQGGSSAGHNGLKSIDSSISPNYFRIRVGIGRSKHQDVSSYVLGKFSSEEYKEILISIDSIIKNFASIFK